MSRSNEAFWWSLFSAGGVVAALLAPALILATGFILPTNDAQLATRRYEHLVALVGWWPMKLLLIVAVALMCFHCAHRARHVLADLGLRSRAKALSITCYMAALLGTFTAIVLVARI